MTFIHGPIISSVGEDVLEILATVDNQIVTTKKNMLVTSFHPELTDDVRFTSICEEKIVKAQNHFLYYTIIEIL